MQPINKRYVVKSVHKHNTNYKIYTSIAYHAMIIVKYVRMEQNVNYAFKSTG